MPKLLLNPRLDRSSRRDRRLSFLLGAILCFAAHAPAEPPRFATSVVDFNHPGGQASGALGNLLGGPRGGGGGANSLHVWSLGISPTDGEAYVTLGFEVVIADGPGPDFIVFENGLFAGGDTTRLFGELAFVEVSTDGATFVRFPNDSRIEGPLGPFATIDPRDTTNLAGNWPTLANVAVNPLNPDPFNPAIPTSDPASAGGTAFDLADLTEEPEVASGAVDLNAINFIRIVDILGDGSYLDTSGDPIYDPTDASAFGNASDIDAVSVIHFREKSSFEWQQFGKSAQGGGRQYFEARVTLLEAPVWETEAESLETFGSVVILPGSPDLVIAWGTSGQDVVVKAFRATDGGRAWTSPALDAGFSVTLESWSTPCADAATNSVFFGTGQTVYRLNGDTGAIEWDTPLEEEGSAEVVNGSIHVGGGLAFVSTYGGFDTTAKRLYALDAGDGSVEWSVPDGGPGSEAPVYLDDGLTTPSVFTLTDRGMARYEATTGTLIWNGSAPLAGESWQTTYGLFGGLSYRDGALFAPTYNFGGHSEVVAVHAGTGQLLWRNEAAVSGDSTPVILGNKVVIAGHGAPFGDPSYVAAYDYATGVELYRTQVSAESSMWNVSPVGTNDALYVTEGDSQFAASVGGLHILDPATGSDLAAPTADSSTRRGTPAIGSDGAVYVLTEGGKLACYRAPEIIALEVVDADGSAPSGEADDNEVRVSLAAVEAEEMWLSTDPARPGAWIPIAEDSTFTLGLPLGTKTIYVQTRNGSGTSSIVSATIELTDLPVNWSVFAVR